jgi:hypothetical protein
MTKRNGMEKQDKLPKQKHTLKWKVKTGVKVIGGLAAIALAREALLDRRYFSRRDRLDQIGPRPFHG